MRVYFVRHGESASNAAREALSSIDPHAGDRLTDLGWEQARKLGQRLDGEGLTHIVTSTMRRARETGRGINETLGLPLETHPDIHEVRQPDEFYRVLGPARTKVSAAVRMAEHDDDPAYAFGNAESFNDVLARVRSIKRYLERTKPDQRMLVVRHGNFLRFFLGDSLYRDEFRPRHFLQLWNLKAANTGITIFDYEPVRQTGDGYDVGGWRLVTWMDQHHL